MSIMLLKNLLRRKGRTLLTILGISIGVATIIGLGALADGLEASYNAMLSGSKSDLVLSQPDAFDISYSSVDEKLEDDLAGMSEISQLSGMLQGFIQAEGIPIFFIFGYPEDSYILSRFQIIEGVAIDSREASWAKGKPLLLGSAAAEALNKQAGDTIRLMDSVYRIVGIYRTGDGFEDGGAVLKLHDAQSLLGKPNTVSLFYIQLKDTDLKDRLIRRVERRWPKLSLSSTDDYANKQILGDMLKAYVWVIAGLAIVIGGVGMTNAQLMSVFERTREIGVLRAVGWRGWRVVAMILGESIIVSLAGGLLGVGLGWFLLFSFAEFASFFGTSVTNIRPELFIQAFGVVLTLGVVGGVYPAWRAAGLQPVEALRYEGGSTGGGVRRLPVGGMAMQSLWQRSARTVLTLCAIGITVGGIMALEGIVRGAVDDFGEMSLGTDVEIMVRQADISDTSLSALDERLGDKIAALPEVEHVSGMIFTAVMLPDVGSFFVLQGFAPNEYSIQRLQIVEGKSLTSNHQILLGKVMAEAMNKGEGDTIELGGTRFRIVGVFETGVGWEELGGVITLRDAQSFIGRPRKVTLYGVKLKDPGKAEAVVEEINAQDPEVFAALTGEFVEQMPDMQTADGILNSISALAIMVGGVGVMNTMLMAVFERTREIGVLRALGWRSRGILALILKEAILLGLFGGVVGIVVAMVLVKLLNLIPVVGQAISIVWGWDIFVRAMAVALLLGLMGGLYPAYRATRLQPVEAIRYE
jgi:ABC-type lipoprotein release transport system permease subunit